MTIFFKYGMPWQIVVAASSEIQTIFVAVSIVVVIAALLFAGYILIRHNGHVKPEIPPSIEKSHPIFKGNDNDNLPENTFAQPIKEHQITRTSTKEHPITNTPVEEQPIAGIPAKEHPMAVTTAKERHAAGTRAEEHHSAVPAEEHHTAGTPAEEHHAAVTPAKEHHAAGTPAKEHPMAGTPAKEHPMAGTPTKEQKPLSLPSATAKTRTNLKISGFRIVPSNAKIGELITIWFTATNLDSRQISHEIVLKINNQVFNTRIISILPGTIQHLHFKVAITEPGSYMADVNGITGTFIISE